MRDKPLPFSPPSLGEEEIAEVVDTLRSDWITTGPKVQRFEQEFAARVGAPAALALNSCTAAMHVALKALGVGPGDAVITTPMAFCSSAHVIEQVGARPVFADVERDTLNLDFLRVREAAEKLRHEPSAGRLKAILPVHLYGHPCDLDALLAVARDHGVAIVEDAAHAFPARYRGRTIGSMAASAPVPVVTCFSFYATKNLTTGEGGMLTGLPQFVEAARAWSLHGMSRDSWKRHAAESAWSYEVDRPGFKYNMTDLAAAIGLGQLRKLDSFQARRREIAQRYNAAFSFFEELETPAERREVEHAWHLYVLRLRTERLGLGRDQFIEELTARHISSSVHFRPIHLHRYYRDKYGCRPEEFPVAWRECQRIVSLPLYPRMTDQDVEDVVEAVRDIVENCRARTTASAQRL
ncbi:MAG TPA: DegT/DnrJ/EryC1/StrS aminotransferase family protein [Terriglobia bacterium]|nr:DegT/DnrJ/EryC1/StrS aminotransferase family protein [Terriglobia bacterium]